MYRYEKTVAGNINRKKLWECYADVSRWKDWDMDVEEVVLHGAFTDGTGGVLTMKNGQALPFTLEDVVDECAFTTRSRMGEISIALIHRISERSITHVVVVEGGSDAQTAGIGAGITAHLPATLERLLDLVVQ